MEALLFMNAENNYILHFKLLEKAPGTSSSFSNVWKSK